MIFGARELAARRIALVERSTRLRFALAGDLKPLRPGVAAASVLRTTIRWGSRAVLLYSLLKRR